MAEGAGKRTREDKAAGAAWLMGSCAEVPGGPGLARSHPALL